MSSPTGRLTATLGRRSQRVVYGELSPPEVAAELRLTSTVDTAHVVMLAECGLLPRESAALLLRRIAAMRADGFADLRGLPMPRGVYLAYENHLSELLGAEVGGRLHTARSRNDLKATTQAMTLREQALELVGQLNRALAILLARARAHRDTVMPVYTHYQAAMPVTYGYYLLGVAHALSRDILALRQAAEGLRVSPLGANAVAGTDLPINPRRTAELLGFDSGPVHAIDAVASRDAGLRVLAAASGAALTLSRLAADLQLWSTVEFGFVEFPDRLVGGSSAMPQKRNAFLLEHVKAAPAQAIGAWTAMAGAVKAAPFTNSIEVGTMAMSSLWPGLKSTLDSVLLTQVLVSGARPGPERMLERTRDGFVTATMLANRLVQQGVPFREAHHRVGDAVRTAVAEGTSRLSDLDDQLPEAVQAHSAGGGPGAFELAFATARDAWEGHVAWARNVHIGLEQARLRLEAAVNGIAGSTGDWFALVESNTTGSGRQFCAAARARGMRPVVLAQDPGRYPYLVEDDLDVIVCDTSDLETVFKTLEQLAHEGLCAVASSSEYFAGAAAEVAGRLGLPGPDGAALTRCRDKDHQRDVLRAHRVPTPDFERCESVTEATAAAARIGLPVVLKPTSGSGSSGVKLCTTLSEVEDWAGQLLAVTTNERGMPIPQRLLVEEYAVGPEFSVEVFDHRAVAVVGKHVGAEPFFVEIGHDVPARVSEQDTAALRDCAERAVEALGVGWGASHTELRLTPSGPVIIEVNPRLAGGMIPTLVHLATGVDLIDRVVAHSSGQTMAAAGAPVGPASIRFVVAPHDGTVSAVSGVDSAAAAPGVHLVSVTARPGQAVAISHSFRDRVGYVIASGDDAPAAADAALKLIQVTVA